MKISFLITTFMILIISCSQSYAGWRTELNLGRPDHSLRLNKKKKGYRYISDPSIYWKLKFGYGPLKLSYGAPIKNTKTSGKTVDGADYIDFEVRLYLYNILLEYIYKKYQGFYAKNENAEGVLESDIRKNLVSRERTYQLFYAFNPNFEIKKVVSVADNGVGKIEFSFILITGGNRWKVSDREGVFRGDVVNDFPDLEYIREIRFNHVFLGGGPGIIIPLNSFLHLSTFLTFATGPMEYNVSFLSGEKTQVKKKFASNYNLKINLGTYGEKWNTGLRGVFLSNQYNLINDKSFFTIDYEVLTYLSYSF